MNSLDNLYVKAQITIAMTLMLLFFTVIFVLILYWHDMSAQQAGVVGGLLTVLPTLLALVLQSFFPKHTTNGGSNVPGPSTIINAASGTTVNHNSGSTSSNTPAV